MKLQGVAMSEVSVDKGFSLSEFVKMDCIRNRPGFLEVFA